MIRYAISPAEVYELVDAQSASWRQRASNRTQALIEFQEYRDGSPDWSEIKPAFMQLQFNKCIFCEQRVEGGKYGKINHDLEHFRPKSSVVAWPRRDDPPVNYATGGDASGYYWLAYELSNYAASCKVCNSTLKSNCFPIAANRGVPAMVGEELWDEEKPFICYPIGTYDRDPEELIEFEGTIAKPTGKRGHKRHRGEVMVEFFRLNQRDELQLQRAEVIRELGNLLKAIDDARPPYRHEDLLEQLVADSAPHASCARHFFIKWQTDRGQALDLHRAATDVSLELG